MKKTEVMFHFVSALDELYPASDCQIYLPDSNAQVHLVYDNDGPVEEEDGVQHTPTHVQMAFDQNKRHISDRKAGYAIPFLYDGEAQGVVRLHVHDDVGIDAALEIVDVLASFAACGFINTVDRKFDERMGRRVEQMRLAAMSELAAAVSHQLNNPLTTMLADTEILMDEMENGTPAYDSMARITRAGRRAAEVVRRLMAVSSTRKIDDMPQLVDVPESIHNALRLTRRYLENGRITIHEKIDIDLPPVLTPPDVLDDVWLNLLMNARDALEQSMEPHIGIETRYIPETKMIEVVVWDNGDGIPESQWDFVFKPFFTTKPTSQRMGLGLHISRQIVERIGGTITVGHHDDRGASFTVQLPAERGH